MRILPFTLYDFLIKYEIKEKNISFSDGAKAELATMYTAVRDILILTVEAFESDNIHLAEKVEPLEEVIDHLRAELKNRHIRRLQRNECTIELGFIFSDILTDLERVSDHCSNIAACMIQLHNDTLNTHKYLNTVRSTDEYFQKKYKTNSEKYVLPPFEIK